MQIKTITYQRVKNLGNYESERLEMTCHPDEDEDPTVVAQELRLMVNQLLDKPTEKESNDNMPERF